MKKKLQLGPEGWFGLCALGLLVFIVLFYFWGIGSIVSGFNQAFSVSPVPSSATQFQSQQAQSILQTRGIGK